MNELKLTKEIATKLYPESPDWFKKQLDEVFGKKLFQKRDFREIKTFQDACNEIGIDFDSEISDNDTLDERAYKKLKIIVKAINQGWVPNWKCTSQYKWWPYFVLPSGFGFSYSYYDNTNASAGVGSRLCFESEEKCIYAANQFLDIYKDFLT